jgi:hypothetical protein
MTALMVEAEVGRSTGTLVKVPLSRSDQMACARSSQCPRPRVGLGIGTMIPAATAAESATPPPESRVFPG